MNLNASQSFRLDLTESSCGQGQRLPVQNHMQTTAPLNPSRQSCSVTRAAQQDEGGLGGFTQRLKVGIRSATQVLRIRPPGTQKIGGRAGRRDPNTVFVAGSTGRLGARIVRELLADPKLKVRAGKAAHDTAQRLRQALNSTHTTPSVLATTGCGRARNTFKANEFAETAKSYGMLTPAQAKRLTVVPVDLEDEGTIAAAIGNAGRVVQAIGASETNLLDTSGPKRVDGEAAINLVKAADKLGVLQYVMVTSLGTGKFGWPASALNLFWGVLKWKKMAEEALEASNMSYLIVRPGGMERPGDDYKRTNNMRLENRDKLFGGQVSRLQVAELVAAAVSNPDLAENKVLEVVAEPTAPRLDYVALLGGIPSEITQVDKLAQRKETERLKVEQEQAQEQIVRAEADLEEARQRAARQQQYYEERQAAAADTEAEVRGILQEAESVQQQAVMFQIAELQAEAEQARREEQAAKAVLEAATAAAKEGRSLTREEVAEVENPILSAGDTDSEPPQPPSGRLGGLFGATRKIGTRQKQQQPRVSSPQPVQAAAAAQPSASPSRQEQQKGGQQGGGGFFGFLGGAAREAGSITPQAAAQAASQKAEAAQASAATAGKVAAGAGKAAVQSAAQSPEGKQQGSRWPWQQEDAANQAADAVQQQAAKAASAVEAGVESVQSKWDAQRKENAQRNAEMVARQKAEREQQRALAAAKQSAKDAQAPPKPAPKPAAKPAAAAKPTPEAQVKTAPKDAKKPVPSAQKAKPQAVAAGAKPAKVAPTAEADGSSQGGAAQARAWINDWRASQTGARAAVPYDTPANVAQTGAYSDLFGA
eukprot:jgi/Astpho2/1297/Aster-06173